MFHVQLARWAVRSVCESALREALDRAGTGDWQPAPPHRKKCIASIEALGSPAALLLQLSSLLILLAGDQEPRRPAAGLVRVVGPRDLADEGASSKCCGPPRVRARRERCLAIASSCIDSCLSPSASIGVPSGWARAAGAGDARAPGRLDEALLLLNRALAWNALSYQEKVASGSSARVFGISLVFVFLILAALYESWSAVPPCPVSAEGDASRETHAWTAAEWPRDRAVTARGRGSRLRSRVLVPASRSLVVSAGFSRRSAQRSRRCGSPTNVMLSSRSVWMKQQRGLRSTCARSGCGNASNRIRARSAP